MAAPSLSLSPFCKQRLSEEQFPEMVSRACSSERLGAEGKEEALVVLGMH